MMGFNDRCPMYSITFRQIEVFLEICRAGNFSGAAGQLQVSQPAISNVIRALESQLGIELFERRRGASCVLSREGTRFRDSAQQFLAQCEAIGRGGRPGRRRLKPLRAFIGGHLLEDFVRPMLPEFYDEHPQLQMNFLPERGRDQILQDIQANKIDVAVITVPAEEGCRARSSWARSWPAYTARVTFAHRCRLRPSPPCPGCCPRRTRSSRRRCCGSWRNMGLYRDVWCRSASITTCAFAWYVEARPSRFPCRA